MRVNTKYGYYSEHRKYTWLGDERDIKGLFQRLHTYKGQPKSLIQSFDYWVENKPNFANKPSWVFKGKAYSERGEQLRKRIIASDKYPSNYIRVKDRSGMLAVIELFK